MSLMLSRACHLIQETSVQNTFDDIASTIHQSLGDGPLLSILAARLGAPSVLCLVGGPYALPRR